jgi:hypothetical protein
VLYGHAFSHQQIPPPTHTPGDPMMLKGLVCCGALRHQRQTGHAARPPHHKGIVCCRFCSDVQHINPVVWDRSQPVTPYVPDCCAALGGLQEPHSIVLECVSNSSRHSSSRRRKKRRRRMSSAAAVAGYIAEGAAACCRAAERSSSLQVNP